MPSVGEEVVVGVRDTCVFDQVLEVTVRTSAPGLSLISTECVFNTGGTYNISANRLSGRRIDSLSRESRNGCSLGGVSPDTFVSERVVAHQACDLTD